MVSMLNLTKQLSDARQRAAIAFNEWILKQDLAVKEAWEELLIEINTLKVKIAALKAKS